MPVVNEQPSSYQDLLELLDDLPTLIAHTRRRKGMSIREVGRKLRMSDATVGLIESGKTDPKLSTVRVLIEWIAS